MIPLEQAVLRCFTRDALDDRAVVLTPGQILGWVRNEAALEDTARAEVVETLEELEARGSVVEVYYDAWKLS